MAAGVFSLEMQEAVTVREGDSLSLTCKVNGGQGRLSVTWQRKATSAPTAAFTTVISQDQDGVMEKGPEFKERHVRAERPAMDAFTLELDKLTLSDAGVYLCVVSAWKTNSKTISQSNATAVRVAATGELRLLLCRTNHSRIIHAASCIFHASRQALRLRPLVCFRVLPEAQAYKSKQQSDGGGNGGADMSGERGERADVAELDAAARRLLPGYHRHSVLQRLHQVVRSPVALPA